jgi:hypothetical protein
MDKASKAIIQNLMNELAIERQLADQLADALINGGMDRQFQAIAFHEHTRNGFMYPGVKVGNSPESKPKKRGKRSPNHPSIRYKWARPDATNKDFWIQFQQEQDKPYDQDEEN